jgi:Starch-binding associating with outer membrane/Susd and RagB outer membrane lipoprotein
MKKKLILMMACCLLLMDSCNELDNNLQNPSRATVDKSNLDLVLNSVELSFKDFYWDASDIGAALTRQEVMFGPLYSNAFTATSYDALWSDAYQGVLVNAKTIIENGSALKLYTHVGIARTLQAYTLLTLVDTFGDVPYSEAFKGNDNTNPKIDAQADVYKVALASLDSAILNFNKTAVKEPPVANEAYYGGNKAKWIALANTLKLKYYLSVASVDPTAKAKIDELVKLDLVDKADGSEDFQFNYGNQFTNPNSRHPKYNSNYTATGAGDYFGTFYLYAVVAEKTVLNGGATVDDPRRRFYFYRQNGDALSNISLDALPCGNRSKPSHYTSEMPFCHLANTGLAIAGGYWGRDHGDASGIPPDGQKRTSYGVYPAGGLYDNSTFAVINNVDLGGLGRGIAPIWLSSYTEFMKAEAALTLGVDLSTAATAKTAQTALVAGVTNSIEKVIAFPATCGVTVPASRLQTINSTTPIAGSKLAYYNFVTNKYTTATTADAKLALVMKEFYIATFGNGIESYNMYRRTGYPAGMQFTLASDPGPFVRSGYYPANAVNRNASFNGKQKLAVDIKVFWDPGKVLQ